jgi:uncharacterized repeat protein (TIGR01451 family)
MTRVLAVAALAGVALSGAQLFAAVTVTKIGSPAAVSAGDTATFTYIVQNPGTTAGNVTLTDTLPAGVSWTDDSNSCSVDAGTRLLSCSFGTLPMGAALSFTVSGLTDFADCGTLSSTATITSTTGGTQSTAGVVVLCPDVRGTIEPDSLAPGQPFAVTIAVRNAGLGIARSVHVTHPYARADLSWTLSPPDALCSIGMTSVVCNLGDIGPGVGHSMRIVADVGTSSVCGNFETDLLFSVANEPSCCATLGVPLSIRKTGDADRNCTVAVADVFYLINFLFAGGSAP